MNNNNKKSSVVTIIVISAAALALGYFLFKSSPQNQSPAVANIDDHHGGSSITANSNSLNALVGKPMPDIRLSDKDGKTYTTADFKGKNAVLFFNEGLMCYPACWNQIAAFGSDQRFNSGQTQAISVVVDSAADWQKAISQMPQLAKATTMFDNNANASRQLGVLNTDSSMHRGMLPGHTYIVLDKEGIVRYIFDDPNMAVANDMLSAKIAELNK
jgi:peroxiredoxin Q/BCP